MFEGATWGTSILLKDLVLETTFSTTFQAGTYLIKAVDLSGNESENATAIITYNPGTIPNVVAQENEHPDFDGVKDNVVKQGNTLVLGDPALDGYYYFDNMVDLTGVYTSYVSAYVVAGGAYVNNIFDMDDIFAESDLYGEGSNNLFDYPDLFAVDDIFGIGADAWEVQLEFRSTTTDPNASPAGWRAWQPLTAGYKEFWAIQFRLKMVSLQPGISPQIFQLGFLVNMPDRIEKGEDIEVLAAGVTVTFDPAFKEIPAIAITIQDGDVDDRIEYVSKTAGGFSFKVYNETAGGYVNRTFDFIAAGYGRVSA